MAAIGQGTLAYAWVPVTDEGLAPVIVKFGGLGTLRLSTTTGLCYPNYLMLVPATGISMSASRTGNDVSISFPTQLGSTYRVFYRSDLSTGSWTLLGTVIGDGNQKSITDSLVANQRFYRVTSP
jgi:hypothetical protein